MGVTQDQLDEFSRIPVNALLGFKLISRSSETAVISMEVKPEYLQQEGVVHGGLVTAVADSAAVHALYPGLEEGRTMTSIEFKINFLRPALVGKGPVTAVSTVVKRGRTIGLCDVEVSQSGVLIAKGLFTYLFSDRVR